MFQIDFALSLTLNICCLQKCILTGFWFAPYSQLAIFVCFLSLAISDQRYCDTLPGQLPGHGVHVHQRHFRRSGRRLHRGLQGRDNMDLILS